MGLFGYNQKDFNKNTATYKDDVTALLQSCYMGGAQGRAAAKTLNEVLQALDMVSFPQGANSKEQAAVDARITEVLNMMKMEGLKKNYHALSEYSDLLFDAISTSRAAGSEQFSKAELEAKKAMATLRSELFKVIDQRQAIEKQKEDIMAKAKATEDQAALAKYRTDYNNLDAQEKALAISQSDLAEAYNARAQEVSGRSIGARISLIKNTKASPAEISREFAQMDQERATTMGAVRENVETITNITGEWMQDSNANSTASGAFDQVREARKNEDAVNAINNASVSSGASAANDPFSQAYNK